MGYIQGIEGRTLMCFALDSHPRFWTMRFITQLKSGLSGVPVALVVLNHVCVCSVSFGLISIKLAGDDVVFHSKRNSSATSNNPCTQLATFFFFNLYSGKVL